MSNSNPVPPSETPDGTYHCPICNLDTPHTHPVNRARSCLCGHAEHRHHEPSPLEGGLVCEGRDGEDGHRCDCTGFVERTIATHIPPDALAAWNRRSSASPDPLRAANEIDGYIWKRITEREDSVGAIAVWTDPNGTPLHVPSANIAVALGCSPFRNKQPQIEARRSSASPADREAAFLGDTTKLREDVDL